ncbi:MAG: choice-of-anchor L domain-containing protein [Deltaproteobacteria bacterium]|nr:choice-of-anchor L domain-containing protein [Deltaproteobacteria bacterium]
MEKGASMNQSMRRFLPALMIMVMAGLMFIVAAPASAGLSTQALDSVDVSEDDSVRGPDDLVDELLGEGIDISNVEFSGKTWSAGSFSGGGGIIGFESGIVLSSGDIANIIGSTGSNGPNVSDWITRENGLPGDSDLDEIISGTSDATILEFDFVPSTDTVTFEYVFGSDEHNEYANTEFNDVFAFFINGENEALIPGTNIVVSINEVNKDDLSSFYRNNDISDFELNCCPINTEMDGLTTVLSVTASVNANVLNHIKLAIADVGDSSYDSWVLIKAGSFRVADACECDFVIDLFDECAEDAENHGEFVSCVADITNVMKQDGSLTGKEKGLIQSCAAQADIPDGDETTKGNNGVGNGADPQPPGNPPINDGEGTSPGNPGNKGKK